ncbi:MAG: DMT family transporter [Candidatus Marinimicrobia bacterium]|nr:DMT family transporter [Candidatus Neomarinimicrobiota bacterium]
MLLKQEKFHILRLAALCVSFSGVLILVLGGKRMPGGVSLPGILLAFSTTFVWTFYWLTAKSMKVDPVISLWIPFTTGALILSILALFFFHPDTLSAGGVVAAGYVGLFEMSITFLLWLNALRRTTSTALVSNFIYAVPFLSLLCIRFVLGETILPTTVIGLVLITGGIILQLAVHASHGKSSGLTSDKIPARSRMPTAETKNDLVVPVPPAVCILSFSYPLF